MRRLLCVGLVLATLAVLAQAQAPVGDGAKAPGDGAKGPVEKRIPLDKLKFPPNAIVVVVGDDKDGVKGPARMVLLTPEEYQRMSERLTQLERLLKGERKTPSACRLRATVEGDFVQLQADFTFETREPRTGVLLGCRGAHLTDAKLKQGEGEGTFPLLDHGPAGYTVLVEKAGEYQLTLTLRLGLTFAAGAARTGAERGFDLGLPGAAVTTLTLELPYAVKEVRWTQGTTSKGVERPRQKGSRQKRWDEIALGPATTVNVTWQEPAPLPQGGPLLTAKGQVVVRLEEKEVVTTAELTLIDLRGQVKEWRLWLPPSETRPKVTPPEGIVCTQLPPRDNVHILQLNEPTGEPIKVTVTVTQPRAFGRLPVGPFVVLGAFRQDGTIEVRAAPLAARGVRLQYLLNGAVDRPADPKAAFRYANMTVPAKLIPLKDAYAKMAVPAKFKSLMELKDGSKAPAPGTAPLEIEIKSASGRVETRVEHELFVRPTEQGLAIKVTTAIVATPLGEPVDFLDVQLPRDRRADAIAALAGPSPAGLPGTVPWAPLALSVLSPHVTEGWRDHGVEVQFPDAQARALRRARVWLAAPLKDSRVILTNTYTLPPGTQRVRLDLPRPLAIKDGGARVKLKADESLELLAEGPGPPEIPAPGRQQHAFDLENAPAAVDIAWRPYRPELPVAVEVDLTFHERDARVRQQFTFAFPERQGVGAPKPAPRTLVRLRVPPEVRGLEAVGRWELSGYKPGAGAAWATLVAGASPREPLTLEYDFVPPHRGGGKRPERAKEADEGPPQPFLVPLPWPEAATRAKTKVRLWATPAVLPSLAGPDLAGAAWKERATEVVPGRGLPARVLLSDALSPRLLLRLDPAPPALAGVVIERALIQAAVDEDGMEHYRARFLLTKLNVAHLDVKLPAAAAIFSLQMRLDGNKVDFTRQADNKVVRVALEPGLFARPVVLEATYQLPRNQPEAEGVWQTLLHPPEILGNVFLGRVRWQVTLPPNWVPVVAGADLYAEQGWGWQGWLPAPEPAVNTAQLEQWLTGKQPAEGPALPSLVCSRTSLEPLRILRLPQQGWFLVCSGAVLLVGLGLYFAPLSHYSFWAALALLGLGVVAAGALWPSVLPAVLYGCEPGLAVLLVLLGFQWMLHQRYRRQVVFLPGFKRLKSGSSLVRNARPREPSTVDSPTVPEPSKGSSSKGS